MNYRRTDLGLGFLAILVLFIAAGAAQAQSVTYPIKELGNCGSKAQCKAYCDTADNLESCIAYAEKNNLMRGDEIQKAKKFIAAGKKGPGGCTGKESCETFCNELKNIEACVAFAEESGLMDADELAEAKKIQTAIRSGVKPPACGNKRACDDYCENPDNMAECITFAKAAGLMSAEEASDADKMLTAIQSGAKPPACRGKEACEAYCGQEEHFSECVEFGKAAGFMSDEEYEMAKKTGGKGPGGCRGKENCDAFCEQPENEETCFRFAEEKGLISEERQRQMGEDRQKVRDSFGNMPPDVMACLKAKLGEDAVAKIQTGETRVTRAIGDALPACFKEFEANKDRPGFIGPIQPGAEGRMPEGSSPSQFQGPPPGAEGQYMGPPPGSDSQFGPPSGYECPNGECRPPEGMTAPYPGSYPPAGYQCPDGNCRPAEQMTAPVSSEPSVSGESIQSAVSEPSTVEAPAPVTQTAPSLEASPVPSTDTSVTAESFGAAVILFLKPLGLNQ